MVQRDLLSPEWAERLLSWRHTGFNVPAKGQVTVRYYGLSANAHRGKIKARHEAFPLRMVEEELRPVPAKGWAEMIRKAYEVDPMVCPQCGGQMKVV